MKTLLGYGLVAYIAMTLGLLIVASHAPRDQLALSYPAFANTNFGAAPKFDEIDDVRLKKEMFFQYFTPIIDEYNRRLLVHRQVLLSIKTPVQETSASNQHIIDILDTYANEFGVDIDQDKNIQLAGLLKKINVVPRSLALAQAANESAWGTSRFARQANNYFGQWCFTQGCGLVPKGRAANAVHEVRAFSSPAASVASYMHNINTHRAYEALRQLRADIESNNQAVTGVQLAQGLINYSERGEAYIEEIQGMINSNKLSDSHEIKQLGNR